MTNIPSELKFLAGIAGIAGISYLLNKRHGWRSGSNKNTKDGPQIEDGVEVGSHVIAKVRNSWIGGSPYIYGTLDQRKPIVVSNAKGIKYLSEDLEWVMLAQDDGWLAPYGIDWQQPGRHILMQLTNREWVSAKVADDHQIQAIKAGPLQLKLSGVDGLSSVCIQTDVAYLFTPHAECLSEFGHGLPSRGGRLADHIADAFEPEHQNKGEKEIDALKRQRGRWVEKSRSDGQYPLRSVWVHPEIKEGALNEFARRAIRKKQKSKGGIHPEVVMLVGPPAAGKSSISRLKPDQLSGPLKPLRKTAESLKYREEVNNDNLTDCMPGFAFEYKYALSFKPTHASKGEQLWSKAKLALVDKDEINVASRLKWIREARLSELSAEAWALHWLTYLVYHHGPVRDSLALDVIKVTTVDANELPVYYSSCMAGKAMDRTMLILELSHSSTKPVPHKPLAFRGFWPYTSQEARFDRQAARANEELEDGELKGGNLTSNLVDIHYHAQQAEKNITKMLNSLHKNLKPSDDLDSEEEEKTDVKVDHFLVIDNEGKQPNVLIDFAGHDASASENIQSQLRTTVEEVISERQLFEKVWDDFDPYLFRICFFFLEHTYGQEDHPMRTRARLIQQQRHCNILTDPNDVLPMVTEIDEEVFFRKYGKRSTATDTDKYRENDHKLGDVAKVALEKEPIEYVERLKCHLSVLRKYTCLAIMQSIKGEGDWLDTLRAESMNARSL